MSGLHGILLSQSGSRIERDNHRLVLWVSVWLLSIWALKIRLVVVWWFGVNLGIRGNFQFGCGVFGYFRRFWFGVAF